MPAALLTMASGTGTTKAALTMGSPIFRRALATLMRRRAAPGRLTAIFVSERAGVPMRAIDSATVLAGCGLDGDRYAAGRGYWRVTDACEITLIQAEDLLRAERRHGLAMSAGQHRRNLVVEGLAGVDLRQRRLRIGEVLLDWHRLRPPCGYLDQVAGRGMARALGRRSGHCLRVRRGGTIEIGDSVEVLGPVPDEN